MVDARGGQGAVLLWSLHSCLSTKRSIHGVTLAGGLPLGDQFTRFGCGLGHNLALDDRKSACKDQIIMDKLAGLDKIKSPADASGD